MGLGMRKRTMISPIEVEIVKEMSLGPDCGGGDVICEDVEVGLVNLMRHGLEGGGAYRGKTFGLGLEGKKEKSSIGLW